ncbi:MAG: efflux RND transporter periplasmic adaptor subunit [Gammaproteobacteria bacterium]
MDTIFTWFKLLLKWMSNNPWVVAGLALILIAVAVWQIRRGSRFARRTIVNVVGIGLLAWGTLWFTDWVQPSLTSEQLFTPPVLGPQPVNVTFVTQKTFTKMVTYTGTVYPYERVVVNARSNGFLEGVNVYPGDRIEANRVIAQLETTELNPRLQQSLAELEYQRAELERDEELARDGAIPDSALDLSRSKERVAAARVNLLTTEIEYATITAQSDGWVSERFADPGQYVKKGEPIIAYDRLSRVRVRFEIAEQDLTMLAVGSEVVLEFPQIPESRLIDSEWSELVVEGYKNPAITAQVSAIFPRLNDRSRLGTVEMLLPNKDLIVKSNTYVIGHLITASVEDTWVVPERALTPMPGGKTVIFLAPAFADQGEVEMREVRVGLRNGSEVQIIEGLEENAYVVTSGNRSLTSGEVVTVLKREGSMY